MIGKNKNTDKAQKIDEPFALELWAWLALLFEHNWTRFLPPLSIIGLFAAFAFFDLFIATGIWGHLLLLSMFTLALSYSLYHFTQKFYIPDWQNARRRLEQKSPVLHRPLTTALDSLPQDENQKTDPIIAAAWARHQEKAKGQIDKLRVGTIESDSAKIDKFALRALVLLFFFISVIGAWGRMPERLNFAIFPDLHAYGLIQETQLDAWINPPEYTNMPPISLATAQKIEIDDETPAILINTPENSLFTAHINGGRRLPHILFNHNEIDFLEEDRGLYAIEQPLQTSGILEIWQGRKLYGRWQIEAITDSTPEISFTTPPSATEDATLKIAYEGHDDYGVSMLNLTIELNSSVPAFAGNEASLTLPISLSGQSIRSLNAQIYRDLSSHLWAGLEVSLYLTATDDAAQTGTSEIIMMTLPERNFEHPVARAIIAARKDFIFQGDNARASSADILFELAAQPDDFNQDIAVFLGLRMAANRLYLDYSPEAHHEIQKLMWETAIQVEDGNFGQAARNLREAQENLAEALADETTSDVQIQQLMTELQEAMQNYMQAMAEEMMERYMSGEEMPLSAEDMANMEIIDLAEMMENMEDMAALGARQEALNMLDAMRNQMAMMQEGMNTPFDPERARQADELMQAVQDLIEQQRDLLERSHEAYAQEISEDMPQNSMMPTPILPPAHQDQIPDTGENSENSESGESGESGDSTTSGNSPSPMPPQNMGGGKGSGGKTEGDESLRAAQENIRRQLGELMLQSDALLGEIPENFGSAATAMQDAENALEEGNGRGSLPHQSAALQALSSGANEMQQMMQGQMPMMIGIGMGGQMGRGRQGRGQDPFGRPNNGRNTARDGVEVPEIGDIRRAREILEELHRRASQFTRPQEERDYINRLMQRF